MWGSPTTVIEAAPGPVSRQSVTTYDAADRVLTVAISGTGAGDPVATTRSVYSTTTGDVLKVQSLSAGGSVTASVTRAYDNVGRLTSYTDATGATTATTYDQYGNPATATQVIAGVTTTTTYGYADPRGYLTSITDSVAGTISATWGPDGQLETQALPGGVTLRIGYDPARVPVTRTYTRDSDGAVIWTDNVTENHRGQWITHASTTGTATYTYDMVGRLTGVSDLQAGTGGVCTTRAYGFAGNLHSNRTQYATATSTTQACPSVSLATTATYDSADRLVSTTSDPAGQTWTYDALGRTTTMPNPGGPIAATFYVNDQIATQTQAGIAQMTWALDPLQRRTTNTQNTWVNGAWAGAATKIAHYANDSDEPSWITEDATLPADVTRYVWGVEGDIAVTTSTTGDRVLQLVDLHGDVVGTAPIADGATTITPAGIDLNRTDEFGNPQPLAGEGAINGPPARYGWLGAAQRSAETLGSTILMGVRLYSTATGRFLSVDPVPGGSANAYDYCNADPVNCTDLGGTFSFKSLLSAVAIVGEVASFIPGPIGAAAAGISAVAYAAQGNTSKAIEMGITAAAQLVGAGAVVRVAARAVNVARSAGQLAARAGPRLQRTVSAVQRVLRPCNSFVPGTLVVMADGSLAPIESLATGDLVLSTDPLTGATAAQPVLAPITGTGTKHLVDVLTDAGTWTATANHPIWVEGKGWTLAGDLTAGDQLVGSTGGLLVVQAMHDHGWLSGQTVHNLSVGGTHTYYIASPDGTVDALVHNTAATCPARTTFIGFVDGPPVIVPRGAVGPIPTRSPGIQFRGGSGGNGLNARVTRVRIMDRTAHHPARVVYQNRVGQTVHPYTGRTISYSSRWAHL